MAAPIGASARSAPLTRWPPQIAAQERDQFFCDHSVRQILWTVDGGAMQNGARRGRDHPQRQIHVPDVDVRRLKEPSHRLEYRRVDRGDVSICQRGHLLGEDPVQSGRVGVSRNACRNERANRGFELPRGVLREHLAQRRPLIGAMPSTQFSNDRFLSREVLVKGRDVDAGALGDSIRRQFRVPLANQNVSRRLEQCLDSRARSFLSRRFSGRKLSFTHRLRVVGKCKLTQYK